MACLFVLIFLPAPILGLLCGLWLAEYRRSLLTVGGVCPGCLYDRRGIGAGDPCSECGLTTSQAAAGNNRRHPVPALLWIPLGMVAFITADSFTPPRGGFSTACLLLAFVGGPIVVAVMVGVPRFGRDARTPWLISLVAGGASAVISGIWLASITSRTRWSEYGPEFDFQVGGLSIFILTLGVSGYLAALIAGATHRLRRREVGASTAAS